MATEDCSPLALPAIRLEFSATVPISIQILKVHEFCPLHLKNKNKKPLICNHMHVYLEVQ